MRYISCLLVVVLLYGCDDRRVYEKNSDFSSRQWPVQEQPQFEFEIVDTLMTYDLYCNIRNSLDYPFSRVFVNYELVDSTGAVLDSKLLNGFLFDEKTGEPFGKSGLGDIYHNRMLIQKAFRFPYAGKYTASFKQYMRRDTLEGVLAVGLRVERAE